MNTRKNEKNKLHPSFYLGDDVVAIAKNLLGKRLCTKIDGKMTSGIIVETEAYRGAEDRACHAYNNRRTKRTEVMFHNGGICYVYLCYGIHRLLNVVTNGEGIPHAVLIRGIIPEMGVDVMEKRREKKCEKIIAGPGTVTTVLGVDLHHNGISLQGETIWIEEGLPPEGKIVASKRIGVDYAGKDAHHPWRFQLI